jgi:hypothetical protein
MNEKAGAPPALLFDLMKTGPGNPPSNLPGNLPTKIFF